MSYTILHSIVTYIHYLLGNFRPEIRQYLLEDSQSAVPFSRQQRALIHQRAKNISDTNVFVTLEILSQSAISYPLKKLTFASK